MSRIRYWAKSFWGQITFVAQPKKIFKEIPHNLFVGVVAEPPVRRVDKEYGAQYVLVNSSCSNRQVPVLTIGLKPGSLPQELLAFPAVRVLTNGLKPRTLFQFEEALGVFR